MLWFLLLVSVRKRTLSVYGLFVKSWASQVFCLVKVSFEDQKNAVEDSSDPRGGHNR